MGGSRNLRVNKVIEGDGAVPTYAELTSNLSSRTAYQSASFLSMTANKSLGFTPAIEVFNKMQAELQKYSIDNSNDVDLITDLGIHPVVGCSQYETQWGTKYGTLIVLPSPYNLIQIFFGTNPTSYKPAWRCYVDGSWKSWSTFSF